MTNIKALLDAVPPGVVQPDGLTWTRLGEEGGVLHTGGGDGIVYSACTIAASSCPPELDQTMELIAAAPAALARALKELDHARQLIECGCWDKGDGICEQCTDAQAALGYIEDRDNGLG